MAFLEHYMQRVLRKAVGSIYNLAVRGGGCWSATDHRPGMLVLEGKFFYEKFKCGNLYINFNSFKPIINLSYTSSNYDDVSIFKFLMKCRGRISTNMSGLWSVDFH